MQVSLAWNTIDDIDLHVQYRDNAGQTVTLWFGQRFDRRGGMLDVDMNAKTDQISNMPVENVLWQRGSSPRGDFRVLIHHYANRTGVRAVPVTIVVKVDGQEKQLNANSVYGQPPQEVFRFRR